MILGVVAAPFVHYDKFKLLHFLSMWGYILAIVHMLDHAVALQTIASIAVAAGNCVALLAFIVQKVYTKASAGKVTVKKAELVKESGGQHLFLTMSVPNFKFKPGQWGHLAVGKASPVPHPFTLIPGESSDEVRIFMKINRSGFTSKMAKICAARLTMK
ncbi:Duox1 [Symbiodinium pilosum]|uniref:Duox1 protein n=1 Tax=Symbiodinium pilosum TaxID=2952 RepID=A0A812X1R3_SYMPI|nr:Duox1 [Symbiodinium pilosum]